MYYSDFYEYLSLTVILLAALPWAAIPLAGLYALLHWRNSRLARRDTQLGLKFAFHLVFSVALVLGTIGANIVVMDLLGSSVSYGLPETSRFGIAMAAAGFIVAAASYWLISSHSNDQKWPATRRMFTGIRFVIGSGAVFISFILFILAILDEFIDLDDDFRVSGATLLIWLAFTALHALMLMRDTRRPDLPGGDGLCASCGYDLRATLATGARRCPECGEPFPAGIVPPAGADATA